MNERLFRKKSVDKVSSPEQLNDYIRVSNPGVWMVLLSIVILLVGVVVWGIIGHLDTTVATAIVAKDGNAVIYVGENDVDRISVGMTVRTEDGEYSVAEISSTPIKVRGNVSEYAAHTGGFGMEDWVFEIKLDSAPEDGVYKANIVIESISPISFILN